MTKEQKFYNILQDLFVGAKLEGDSGYVNLMNIKTDYFNLIKKKIEDEIKKKFNGDKPEDLYDKLYTFFDSYFSDGGSIFFSSTPNYKNIYAKVYSDREDVSLFWKTAKLYYVKSEANYRTIENLQLNSDPEIAFDFQFDASLLKHKQANEKKELQFYFVGTQKRKGKKIIKFRVIYKNDNKYDKLKDILKIKDNKKIIKHIFENLEKLDKKIIFKNEGLDLKIANEKGGRDFVKAELLIQDNKDLLGSVNVEPVISDTSDIEKYLRLKGVVLNSDDIEKAFKVYKKQTEIDYFIHKDAKGFLREQFDLYMYQNLIGNMETVFEQRDLDRIKKIKEIAYLAIDYIGNFEDELKNIWLKPKFARNLNYVVTLDRLIDKENGIKVIEKIVKHKGIKEQIFEWQELGIVKDGFDKKEIIKGEKLNKDFKTLPIDTKYFKDLEIEIIGLFDNLDEELDGRLIKSDNFQALNTLLPKYKEQVQTIYIDPPYNSPSSEIAYVNNYKSSSWLTLMENRIEIAKELLKKDGIFECAIDDNEQEKLGILIEKSFPEYEKTCVSIVHNPSGTQKNDFLMTHEYIYFVYDKDTKINPEKRNDDDADIRNFMNTAKGNTNNYKRESGSNCFYPILLNKKTLEITGFGDVCDKKFHPNSQNIDTGKYIEIYPIDEDGTERKWVFARNNVENIKEELFVKEINLKYRVYRKKNLINFKSVWTNSKYSAKKYGTEFLKDYGFINSFDFPKSIFNVYDCLYASVAEKKDALILDYFPGSGTTADAIIRINRDDDGKRKFILTEIGEHFYNVIIPRLKKLCVSLNYKKGVPQDRNGNSLFFKYYELEQYEEALKKAVYNPIDEELENIDFSLSEKQAKTALDIDLKKEKAKFVFEKLYPDVDIPETISNLFGKKIKKITKDKVIFEDDSEVDLNNLDFEKYEPLKKLIYW